MFLPNKSLANGRIILINGTKLRESNTAVGFTPNFTIYDATDSKSLVKTIIKEMNLDDKVYKPGMVQGRTSNAKNHLVLPEAYAANAELIEADRAAKVPLLHEIYLRYWNRCRQSDAMDFDDLLLYTYLLFRMAGDMIKSVRLRGFSFITSMLGAIDANAIAANVSIIRFTHSI